jgi:hypothetical protein
MSRFIAIAIAGVLASASVLAQQPAQRSVYQRFAPIDLTGTWVSIVTEDWHVRMLTPAKGDFESLPLTPAAQAAANRVDMAQVEAAGRACEAYGAPVLLREPGRARISWQDAATLKIETDAGQQTRLLQFDPAARPQAQASLQGFSRAEWQYAAGFSIERAVEAEAARAAAAGRAGGGGGRGGGGGGGRGGAAPATPQGGRLKVVTTNLRPGFLRKNGVPYSADTTVTEYYNLITEPSGTQWFVVTTVVNDPANLLVDWITSTNFRKEANDAAWRPRPCTLR